MKLILAISLVLTLSARATVFTYNVDNIFATIPDGNLNGYQNSQTLSGIAGYVTDVNVTLSIAGGFNGDFYAYLYHNNTISILANRVGRSGTSSVGYGDAGFGLDAAFNKFTLDDQAASDLHSYRTFAFSLNGSGQLTGQWQPDGRAIDPLSPGSAFPAAARSNLLGIFNTMDPNGDWRLFLADVSSGSEGTLISWGLQITAVPEPATGSLLVLGLGALVSVVRSRCGLNPDSFSP